MIKDNREVRRRRVVPDADEHRLVALCNVIKNRFQAKAGSRNLNRMDPEIVREARRRLLSGEDYEEIAVAMNVPKLFVISVEEDCLPVQEATSPHICPGCRSRIEVVPCLLCELKRIKDGN